jgi:hypothetical protein
MNKSFENYEEIRTVIYDILAVLAQHGFNTISLGSIMRMLGVPSELAEAHDDEYFHVTLDDITEDTSEDIEVDDITIPPGTTLH